MNIFADTIPFDPLQPCISINGLPTPGITAFLRTPQWAQPPHFAPFEGLEEAFVSAKSKKADSPALPSRAVRPPQVH